MARPELEDLAPAADLRPLAPTGGGDGDHGGRAVGGGLVPGLALVAACVVLAHVVSALVPSISPLVASVAIGAVLANVGLVRPWARAGAHFAARRLLRLGVVLLGFQLAVGDVLELGGAGIALVAVVVASTFVGTRWLGRRLGVSPSLSLLIATGFSICGASAVAAVEGVSDADEEEVAFAVALVTLCGSLAIVVLPALAGPLGLTDAPFGSWVGASVHDIAQVVATSAGGGTVALQTAVVVKLTRIVLLAPMVAGLTVQRRRRTRVDADAHADRPVDGRGRRPPLMPLFVAGFLAAIAARSFHLVPVGWLGPLKVAETSALAAALVGLGTGVQLARLRRIGGRPLVLGLLAWFLVAGVAYGGVRLIGA